MPKIGTISQATVYFPSSDPKKEFAARYGKESFLVISSKAEYGENSKCMLTLKLTSNPKALLFASEEERFVLEKYSSLKNNENLAHDTVVQFLEPYALESLDTWMPPWIVLDELLDKICELWKQLLVRDEYLLRAEGQVCCACSKVKVSKNVVLCDLINNRDIYSSIEGHFPVPNFTLTSLPFDEDDGPDVVGEPTKKKRVKPSDFDDDDHDVVGEPTKKNRVEVAAAPSGVIEQGKKLEISSAIFRSIGRF